MCGDELPFMFSTRDECSVNLAVMLEHESSDGYQQGKKIFFFPFLNPQQTLQKKKDESVGRKKNYA